MKIKTLSLVIVLLLVSLSFQTLAQQTGDAVQAIIDAKKDAENIAPQERALWGGAALVTATFFGCIGGSVILGVSFFYKPTPPVEKLIGKSPEYISFYTQTYQREKQMGNQIASAGGCIGGSIIAGFLWSHIYQNY